MEFMFKSMDARMNGLEDILIISTARTQQRMSELEGNFKHDMCRNTDKQEEKFGEELRRLEMIIEGLSNCHPANASLEERMRKPGLKESEPKPINQVPQAAGKEKPSGWMPRQIILGGWGPSTPRATIEMEARAWLARPPPAVWGRCLQPYTPTKFGEIAKMKTKEGELNNTAGVWHRLSRSRARTPARAGAPSRGHHTQGCDARRWETRWASC